jgi:hypothetical protein
MDEMIFLEKKKSLENGNSENSENNNFESLMRRIKLKNIIKRFANKTRARMIKKLKHYHLNLMGEPNKI